MRAVRVIHHNLIHYFFVVGTSLIQDLTAGLLGGLLLLLSAYIFESISQDLFKIIFGLPLGIIGVGIILINLEGVLLALTSRQYSINRCPFCRQ